MGGLDIDEKSAVLGSDSLPVPGLLAAGEVAGCVRGDSRQVGISQLGPLRVQPSSD